MTCCKQSWKAIGALIIVAYCQALEQDIGDECTNENGVTGLCQFKNKCSKDTDLGVICNSEETIICCAKNDSKTKQNFGLNNDEKDDQSLESRFGFFPNFFHAPESPKTPISNTNFFNNQKPRNSNFFGNVLHQNLNVKEFFEDRPYQSFEQDVVTKPNKKKSISSTRPTNENNFYSTNNNQYSNIENIFESGQTTRKPQRNYNYPNYETNRPNQNQNINNDRSNYEINTANQNSYNNNNNYASSVTQRPNQNTNNNRPNYESNTGNQNSNNNNNYASSVSQRPNQHQNNHNNQPYYETNTANQNYNNNYLPSSVTQRPNQNSNKQPSSVSPRPNRFQNNNSNQPNQGTHQLNQNNNFNANPSYNNPSTQKPHNNYNSGNYEISTQQPNSQYHSNGYTNHHATSSSVLFPDDSTDNKYQTKFTSTTKKYSEQNMPNGNTKRISEMKCEEYSRSLTTTISAIPLSIDTSPRPVSIEKCDSKSVGLIVGGAKAELGEFPHMVAIGFRVVSGNSWNCGGTLISEQYVLTAAHCTHSVLGDPEQIRLGELNLKNNNDGANPIDLSVDKIIVHPDYVSTSKYNDIALIRLKRSVKFNDHIRPACLYNRNNINSRKVTATGWGSIAYGDRSSDDLLKVDLDVIDNRKCNKLYEAESKTSTLNRGIINSMICAGDLEGGHDTCLGDSGGPLVTRSEKNSCIFNLIGITSFGKFCATENSPGVYTRVSTYLPWIEQIVWP